MATTSAQLRLVQGAPLPQVGTSSDPVRVVFDHWLFILGKSAARCKLGPTRRAAIASALTLYEPDVLLQAIEGMAADPWCGGANRTGQALFDVEWLFAKEDRIERMADAGEAARRRAQQLEQQRAELQARPPQPEAPPDPAARERYRAMLAEMRRAGAVHGG